MKTSSSSFARSTSRPRVRALLAALLVAALAQAAPTGVPRGSDLEGAWFRLVSSLETLDARAVRDGTDELLQIAGRLGVRRLTPYALGLTARARGLVGGDAVTILEQATRCDPGCPEAWLALANARAARREWPAATVAASRGVWHLVSDARLHSLVWGSIAIAGTVALLTGFALWSLLAVRRVVARLWHDLMELGTHWRLGSNSALLGVFVVALPLFAGGDPAWVVLWLLALTWPYLPGGQKALAAGGLVFTIVAATALEVGLRGFTHQPNPVVQAQEVLAERRYEPQALTELAALAGVLGHEPDYYRLRGDLSSSLGLTDASSLAYREGLRLAPENGPLSLALGLVRYQEGDFNAALQAFTTARNAGVDAVIVNYNLSLTYAQTYNFRESDEAITAARRADEHRLGELTKGHDQRPLGIRFSARDAAALLARQDPLTLTNRGLLLPPLPAARTVLHPLTLAGTLALLVALFHLLARQNTTGFALACVKCGRPFCRRCKLAHESQSYCTQCINIFLKKDMVAIEAQVAKRRQLARRLLLLEVERRVADVLLPGLGLAFSGRPLLGGALAVLSGAFAAAGLLWLPRFLAPVTLQASTGLLTAACAGGWLALAAAAQLLPARRRM